MTQTSPPYPDLMIAIPAIRRKTDQRWLVYLWNGEPCRATFRHYDHGHIAVDHSCQWTEAGWVEPLPSEIPPRLRARAHRELRRLARHQEQPITSLPDRLRAVRARRIRRAQSAGVKIA